MRTNRASGFTLLELMIVVIVIAILATLALLRKNPNPTDEEIHSALDGNYCRCTGYVKIIEAVRLASRRMSSHD